jgi:glycosyltransferase involved in cell wall biosynthesis
MVHDYPPLTGGGLALAVRDLTSVLESDLQCETLSSRLLDHYADDRADHPASRHTGLALIARMRSTDLLLAHWTFSFRRLATVALVVAPWLGMPVVWVIHTGPDHCAYNRLGALPAKVRNLLVRRFGRLVERRCAAVVALSPSHAVALGRAGITVTHVLPLPVAPVDAYDDLWRLRVGDRTTPRIIGVIGELSRLKGVDALPGLIDALTPRFTFHVVGRGPLRGELEHFVAGLDPLRRACVTVLEPVPPGRMAEVYRDVGCVLVLSRTESQCRVVLEAMLCGVVVLARRIDGVADLIVHGRTGYFVDPEQPQSVRKALDDVTDHPSRLREMRARARQVAEEHFRSSCSGWRAFVADATDARVTAASASPGRWPPAAHG